MERMMHQNSWCLYHHFNINSSRGCVYTVRRFFLTQAAHITAGCSSVSPKHISAFTVARSEMTDSRTSSDPLVTSNAIQSQGAGQFQKEQEKIKSIFLLAKKMSSWKFKLIVCSLGWRILFCVILSRKERDQEKKGSKFLQLKVVTHWRVVEFGLLTAAACWQLWVCTGLISFL